MLNYLIVFALFFFTLSCDSYHTSDYLGLGREMSKHYISEMTIAGTVNVIKQVTFQSAKKRLNKIQYFSINNANGESYILFVEDDHVKIAKNIEANAEIYFPENPVIGSTWKVPVSVKLLKRRHESFAGGEAFIETEKDILIEKKIVSLNENIKTKAGYFTNCLMLKASKQIEVVERSSGIELITIELTEWYAKGFGLVKRERHEYTTPEKIRASLDEELTFFTMH